MIRVIKNSPYSSFMIEGCLEFIKGNGGLPFIKVDNQYSTSLISIYGAQVLSYKSKLNGSGGLNEASLDEENDLLFVSDLAYFEQGKEIKGGIPICWPWFGMDPENLGRGIHGFARNMLWQLVETEQMKNGETKIVLSLSETEESLKLWPHNFMLTLTATIGKTLHLSLQTVNTSNEAFTITQALHAYFSVTDINRTHVEGLDNVNYLDKVTGAERAELQVGHIAVDQEVDRIYTNAPSQSTIIDSKSKREVAIKSKGSKTTVVWNPWIEISKNSVDLKNNAYQHFICVETANAAEDFVVIEPSESYRIVAEYIVT